MRVVLRLLGVSLSGNETTPSRYEVQSKQVDPYRPLATTTEDVRRAVAAARLSPRCLDLVAGPRSLADAERRAGAAFAEHGRLGRALYAADEDTVDRAYRTFTARYRDVGCAFDALEREGRRDAKRSAEDCRGDVDGG